MGAFGVRGIYTGAAASEGPQILFEDDFSGDTTGDPVEGRIPSGGVGQWGPKIADQSTGLVVNAAGYAYDNAISAAFNGNYAIPGIGSEWGTDYHAVEADLLIISTGRETMAAAIAPRSLDAYRYPLWVYLYGNNDPAAFLVKVDNVEVFREEGIAFNTIHTVRAETEMLSATSMRVAVSLNGTTKYGPTTVTVASATVGDRPNMTIRNDGAEANVARCYRYKVDTFRNML